MPNIELTVRERLALRGLELHVKPPQALWCLLGRVQYDPGMACYSNVTKGLFEFNQQDHTYNLTLNPTQVGQLRAYVRDHADGDAYLHLLHAKLDCLFERCVAND